MKYNCINCIDGYCSGVGTYKMTNCGCYKEGSKMEYRKGDRVIIIKENSHLNEIQIFIGNEATITEISGKSSCCIIFDNGFNYTIDNSFIALIRIDKIEKIVVRMWEDLKGIDKLLIEKEGNFLTIGYCMMTIKTFNSIHGLEKAVKILNALGGNFEYKTVEVIDEFHEFVSFLQDNKISYNPLSGRCFEIHDKIENLSIKEVEEKYNVDFQILSLGGDM